MELLSQRSPISEGYLSAELLQPVGVFLIAPGLRCLQPHRLQPVIHLFHNVRQSEQILINAFQSTRGLKALRLKAANASGLFKNDPPLARRRLQHHINFALLNDAVGFGGDAGAGKQIANVTQPTRLAVDQVFAFAASINAPCDVDLWRIDRQQSVRVIEGQRNFGRIQRASAA
jgi:hypothetical protein